MKLNTDCPCCYEMMKRVEDQQKLLKQGIPTLQTCSWTCSLTGKIVNPRMIVEE